MNYWKFIGNLVTILVDALVLWAGFSQYQNGKYFLAALSVIVALRPWPKFGKTVW